MEYPAEWTTCVRNKKNEILQYSHRVRHDSGIPARHMVVPESSDEIHGFIQRKERYMQNAVAQEHRRSEQDFNNESQACAACGSLGEEFTTEGGWVARLEGSAQARPGLVKRVETGCDMDEIKRVQGMSTLMRSVTSLPGPQSPRVCKLATNQRLLFFPSSPPGPNCFDLAEPSI